MQKFETKFINGNISNLKSMDCLNKSVIGRIRFNSFERPEFLDYAEENNICIALDHNFEIKETDNVLFIDHHLMETEYNEIYESNASMMFDYYVEISNALHKTIGDKKVNIDILTHLDLDGLASLIILKSMLENNISDKNYISLAKVLGNFGDIAGKPERGLESVIAKENDIEIYSKKIKLWSNCFGKFMKAIRPSLMEYYRFEAENNLDADCDIIYNFCNLVNIGDFRDVNIFIVENIFDTIKYADTINNMFIAMFMNNIAQHHLFDKILKAYNNEVNRLIGNYIDPEIGTSEIDINFILEKDDGKYEKIPYKLLTINSPMDCGRSVYWRYRTEVFKLAKDYTPPSPWYFKVTDYINNEDKVKIVRNKDDFSLFNAKNMCCYNSGIKKVSMDGEHAFEICQTYFDGGGHMNIGNGISLGSAVVENDNQFIRSVLFRGVK